MQSPSSKRSPPLAQALGPARKAACRSCYWPVIASTLLVLAVTLVPGLWLQTPIGETPPMVSFDFFLADFAANCLLFLPFGASLALRSGRLLPAVVCSLLLSASVEAVQVFMVYRFANPFDVLANTLGGLAGAQLWIRSGSWQQLSDANANRACAALAGFLAFMLIVSGVLLLPAPPAGEYFLHSPPQILGFEPLSGEIHRVELNGMPLVRGTGLDSQWMRKILGGDFDLRLRASLYKRPKRASLLFMISAEPGQNTVLALRMEDEDLIMRYRAASNVIRLDAVEFRADGALREIVTGQPMTVLASRRGHQTCLRLNSGTYCEGDLGVGETWALYVPQLDRLIGRSLLVSAVWVGGWALLIGFLVRWHWASVAGIGALVATIWAAGHFGALQPLPFWGCLLGVCGFTLGIAIRHLKS